MLLIDDIIRTLELPVAEGHRDSQVVARWKPPEAGWVKFNTDGPVDSDNRRGGVGIVARDHMGEVVCGRCSRYDGVMDLESVELLACRDAMLLAREKNIQQVVIETDCQNIKTLWESNMGERTVGVYILREMRSLVRFFQGVQLRYVSRSANRVAHSAAKEALSSEFVINFTVTPGFLMDLVHAEKLSPIE